TAEPNGATCWRFEHEGGIRFVAKSASQMRQEEGQSGSANKRSCTLRRLGRLPDALYSSEQPGEQCYQLDRSAARFLSVKAIGNLHKIPRFSYARSESL